MGHSVARYVPSLPPSLLPPLSSTKHADGNPFHMLTLNLTSLRVWCYSCQTEVFLENNGEFLCLVQYANSSAAESMNRSLQLSAASVYPLKPFLVFVVCSDPPLLKSPPSVPGFDDDLELEGN